MKDSSERAAALAPVANEPSTKANPPTRASTVIGLLIALSGFVVPAPWVSKAPVANVILKEWLVTLPVVFIAFGVQRRRPSEFGIRWPGWRDLLAGLACVSIALVLTGAVFNIILALPPKFQINYPKLAATPIWLRLAAVVTAGICEEFCFRGFAIEELTFLTGRRWLAIVCPLLAFTFMHFRLYGFSVGLLIPGLGGAAFTVLYLWRRNLPSCMIWHAMADAAFLILPSLLRK